MTPEPSERVRRHEGYTAEQQAERERFLSMSNRELATEVDDLLDGQLAVSANDRVRYGAGVTALGKKAGGQFVPQSQLEDIVAHADQIRAGLVDREGSRGEARDEEDSHEPTPTATVPDPESVDGDDDSESSPEAEPEDTRQEFDDFEIAVIDQSKDARDFARDAAEARLTNELNTGGGRIRRFARNIWKGYMAREYYLQKYHHQAERDIVANQDVLVHKTADAAARSRSREATIERFVSEYDAETVHEQAGEKRLNTLAEDSAFGGAVKQLIRQYASGEIGSLEALREERTRILAELGDDAGLVGEGKVRVDNIVEIATAVKGAIEHGDSLDRILAHMKVGSGEARTGARTEADYNRVDTLIAKWEQKAGGKASFVTPETVAAAASLAIAFTRLGRGSVLKATGLTLIPGPIAGLFAGMRENKRYKDERRQHLRESSESLQIVAGSERREELERTRYETIAANDLAGTLRSHTEGDATLETNEAVQAALDALSMVEARVHMSDARNVDLVSFSSAEGREQERWDLDLARAEAKVALRRRLDRETRLALGMSESVELDQWLRNQNDTYDALSDEIDAKDQLFKDQKLRRVLKTAAIASVSGFIVGEAVQEGVAAFDSTREGLVDQLLNHTTQPVNGQTRQTLIMGWIHGNTDPTMHTSHVGPSNTYTTTTMGGGGQMDISSEHTLTHNPNGTFSLDRPGGASIDNLTMNANGSMPASTLAELQHHGMVVQDLSHQVTTTTTGTRTVGIDDFLTHTDESRLHLTRDLWLDNDTPAPVFDNNELGLDWTGDNTIDAQGGVHMTVAGMTAGGSYHGDVSTNWADEVTNGKLKAVVSLTKDSQAQPFVFDVKPDGSIDIPSDSQVAKTFSMVDGRPTFNGAYVEVVRIDGVDADGVSHVQPLATVEGANNLKGPFEIPTTTTNTTTVHDYRVTWGGEDVVTREPGRVTEAAPFLPIVSRRPLERLTRHSRSPYGYYGRQYGEAWSPERFAAERSPRLSNNPRARLNTRKELGWYRSEIRRRGGDAYADEIDRAVEGSPELRNLGGDVEAIVTIPVAAASESENIYNTLRLYAQQDGDMKRTPILLHVNWFDRAENDPQKKQKIDKTLAEIERARRDFPNLTIATMTTKWSGEKQDRGEYGKGIIGHVTQRLYDTAMMSVQQAMENGQLPDKEVLLIRNDADAQGMDRKYVERMLRLFHRHPDKDIFNGGVRWETARHADLPGLAFATNFREIMHVLSNRPHLNVQPPTIGINMSVRMSTFAAVGGIGHDTKETGAGSDDIMMGSRVGDARGASVSSHYYAGGSSYSRDVQSGNNSYVQYVPGANIDSKADRLEAMYVAGRPITEAWNEFDGGGGGYKERADGLGKKVNERFRRGRRVAVSRVEDNINAMVTEWFRDAPHVSLGLSYLMPTQIHGKPTYRLSTQQGGALQFSFTDEGRIWAQNHLQRDPSIVRKKLYGRGRNNEPARFVS